MYKTDLTLAHSLPQSLLPPPPPPESYPSSSIPSTTPPLQPHRSGGLSFLHLPTCALPLTETLPYILQYHSHWLPSLPHPACGSDLGSSTATAPTGAMAAATWARADPAQSSSPTSALSELSGRATARWRQQPTLVATGHQRLAHLSCWLPRRRGLVLLRDCSGGLHHCQALSEYICFASAHGCWRWAWWVSMAPFCNSQVQVTGI
ncbi:uncharacterized protein LOC125535750 isoform X2 [Triticum urartu]|uniref:uncharacterized protein LOC125535750 isoform X2 n=1 Tax=Triticum urartu TaxID=4572 RepID=UPI0020443DDF|nr:uncharacterized protein LOC125535750 isoform X2 [Triticum urartu]